MQIGPPLMGVTFGVTVLAAVARGVGAAARSAARAVAAARRRGRPFVALPALGGALALAVAAVAAAPLFHGPADLPPQAAPVAGTPASPEASPGTSPTLLVRHPAGWIEPLTGLPGPNDDGTPRPALTVKIDNAPEARPQAGLEQADVVFEEVVEGGITRFAAVFHSNDAGSVGPVRSVRPMDPVLVSPIGGLFAYSGGIPGFVALLHAAPVRDVGVDAAPGAYRRVPGRPVPHNLFVSTATLWTGAPDEPDPPPLFSYLASGEPFAGGPASTVDIAYSPASRVAYRYDAATSTWPRWENGTPHLTAGGQQIAPANLVIQFVPLRPTGAVDPHGTAVLESVVTGVGDAWVISGGRAVRAHWSRPDAASPTRYSDGLGHEIEPNPGSTWVHLVPAGGHVSVL